MTAGIWQLAIATKLMSWQTAIDIVCMGMRHEYRVLIEQQVPVSCSPGLDKAGSREIRGLNQRGQYWDAQGVPEGWLPQGKPTTG